MQSHASSLWDVVFLLRRLTICLCAVVFKGNSYAQAVRIRCMLSGMAPPMHAHACHRVRDTSLRIATEGPNGRACLLVGPM